MSDLLGYKLTQTGFQVQQILNRSDDAIVDDAGIIKVIADEYYGDGSHLTGISTGGNGNNIYFVTTFLELKAILEDPLTSSDAVSIYISNDDIFYWSSGTLNIHTSDIYIYSMSTAFYMGTDIVINKINHPNTHSGECNTDYIT